MTGLEALNTIDAALENALQGRGPDATTEDAYKAAGDMRRKLIGEHTPGPWETIELKPDGVIIKRSGTWEIRTPDYDVCADVPYGAPIRKEADAHLIAAAPDLLAACQELLDLYDQMDDATMEAFNEAFPGATLAWNAISERANAAIAKAKGEVA